jgi:hypothetical protein
MPRQLVFFALLPDYFNPCASDVSVFPLMHVSYPDPLIFFVGESFI